jgi:hypothetical protein
MSVYLVPNLVTEISTFFVPDESTQIDGQQNGVAGNYIIGTLDDANTLLTQNAQAYLIQCSDRFSVCRVTVIEDGVSYTAINLDEEPQNNTLEYQIFNTLTGLHELAIGTDTAKALRLQIQNDFISHSNLSEVKTLDGIIKRKVKSQGTQSL